ncbi:hypothetical protein LSAT2_022003 [Lamellibrachia satsuma]|nr:hypothetical protein LSAT2_022003 [Lamellibrachia satsuma]
MDNAENWAFDYQDEIATVHYNKCLGENNRSRILPLYPAVRGAATRRYVSTSIQHCAPHKYCPPPQYREGKYVYGSSSVNLQRSTKRRRHCRGDVERDEDERQEMLGRQVEDAEAGSISAQVFLGKYFLKCYELSNGRGDANSAEQEKMAVDWLIKASRQGNEEATNLLKVCEKTQKETIVKRIRRLIHVSKISAETKSCENETLLQKCMNYTAPLLTKVINYTVTTISARGMSWLKSNVTISLLLFFVYNVLPLQIITFFLLRASSYGALMVMIVCSFYIFNSSRACQHGKILCLGHPTGSSPSRIHQHIFRRLDVTFVQVRPSSSEKMFIMPVSLTPVHVVSVLSGPIAGVYVHAQAPSKPC